MKSSSTNESLLGNETHEASASEFTGAAVKPDSTALRLWVVLSRAHASITAHASADAARHNLTMAEFGVLDALYHRGPMLLGEVQRKILVSSGGITFLIDRLTSKGLVERQASKTDRRARYAALTRKGARLIERIFPLHTEAIERAVSGLSKQEQLEATALLRRLGMTAAEQLSIGSQEQP